MAAGDYLTSDADLALLQSPGQGASLRVAILPAYTPSVIQRRRGTGETMRDACSWTPDGGMGSHKVGVVGQAISYYVGNAARRDGGAIPDSAKSFDWADGTVVSSPHGIVSHTYSAPGLYEVVFTAYDSASGNTAENHRWVRIFASWADAYDGIAEVSGISGSAASGGWTASLKVTKPTGTAASGDFPDSACVLLYATQEWEVDDDRGTSVVNTIGRATGYDYDPEIVLSAYVVGNTVQVDGESNSVTFQVRTADAFLQQMTIYEMAWLDSTERGHGHVATGLQFSDVANHLLWKHTNWAQWHDFYAWRASWPSANTYKRIVLNQGSIWSCLQSFADNEFSRFAVSRYSSLQIAPNINVRGLAWWGTVNDPPQMPFTAHNCTSIEIQESQVSVAGVELTASNPFKGTTLSACYPPSPPNVGEMVTPPAITCEVQANLTAWAERMYHWKNARESVTVTTAMPKALDLGQLVVVDYADPQGRVDLTAEVGGGMMRMPFYVEGASFPVFDPAGGRWTASYQLAKVVRTRWNLTLQRWQSFDGSTWA